MLSHGAVEAWARGILETAAGILLLVWAVTFLLSKKECPIVLPPLLFPLLALALLAGAQLAFRLTTSPFTTRIELQLMLSMLVLFFLAAQAFRTLADWRSFAWFVMIFAFLVAGLGILQHLTFNGKLYWFRELKYGGVPFGPYVNRNHFAGFAELVLPMSLVPLLLGRVRRERLAIVGMLAIIPLSALLLSASRGGIVSLAAELAFLALVLILRRTAGRHLVAGGVVLLLAFLTVCLARSEPDTFALPESADSGSDARQARFDAPRHVAASFWIIRCWERAWELCSRCIRRMKPCMTEKS